MNLFSSLDLLYVCQVFLMGDNFGAFFTTSLANYHFLSSLIAAINQIPRDSGQNDRRAAGGQKRPHDSLRSPRKAIPIKHREQKKH